MKPFKTFFEGEGESVEFLLKIVTRSVTPPLRIPHSELLILPC